MIGTTLAHYEVTAKLGEGGMGEVYRARDTKLGRDVALKLLPRDVAEDPERLARFEREARTLAQLQHAHIASIYGFEQVGEHRVLVMELAEGQDLAARLKAGPVSLVEALEIARQIALGLEEAHAKGIIHRDLKPANVMLDPKGQVKILDFGLARAFADPPPEGSLEHSPTITAAMTQVGVILGTAAYMSPEQARGRAVDPRTDIWAFGAVLFEMVSGQKPFSGEVVSEVIAQILEREPPWEQLPADCHPLVRALLDRCLAKDPRQRLHSVADARIEIERVLADPGGASTEGRARTTGSPAVPVWRRAMPWVLCAVLAAWALYSWVSSSPPADLPVQFEIPAPPEHEFGEFSVAPDGSALAFVTHSRKGARSLWIRTLDSTEPRMLDGTEDAMFPFWSADSRSVGFFSGGKLRRIDLAGGTVQTIADAPNGRGAAWNRDGTILFTPDGEDVLYRVSAAGGTPVAVTHLVDPETTHRFPHFLPGGEKFVYSAHGQNSILRRRYFASLESDERIRLPDGMSETYAPPGMLLFVREETLYAQQFDGSAGRLENEPYSIASGISDMFPRTARSAFSVSNNGVLAYLQRVRVESRFEWVDASGRSFGTVAPRDHYADPALSNQGDKVAFARSGPTGQAESIWILDLVRGTSNRLLQLSSMNGDSSPVWSPDDGSIYYCDEDGLLRQSLAGGEPELLLRVEDSDQADLLLALREVDVSADSSFLVFGAWDPVSDYDLWIFSLDGTSEPERLVREPRVQGSAEISPDMRWIAYESDDSGRTEVYVRSKVPESPRFLISKGGGSSPRWSADGSALQYFSIDHVLMSVSIATRDGQLVAGLPNEMFTAPLAAPSDSEGKIFSKPLLAGYHDGRFLFQVPAERVPPRNIRVVLNWKGLLVR